MTLPQFSCSHTAISPPDKYTDFFLLIKSASLENDLNCNGHPAAKFMQGGRGEIKASSSRRPRNALTNQLLAGTLSDPPALTFVVKFWFLHTACSPFATSQVSADWQDQSWVIPTRTVTIWDSSKDKNFNSTDLYVGALLTYTVGCSRLCLLCWCFPACMGSLVSSSLKLVALLAENHLQKQLIHLTHVLWSLK